MEFNPCCINPDIQETDRMSEPLFVCTECGEPHCTPKSEECNCNQALTLKEDVARLEQHLRLRAIRIKQLKNQIRDLEEMNRLSPYINKE